MKDVILIFTFHGLLNFSSMFAYAISFVGGTQKEYGTMNQNKSIYSSLEAAAHFMFDFETDGLHPWNNSIIEIGIKQFSLRHEYATTINNSYQIAVQPSALRKPNPATIEWHKAAPERAKHYEYLCTHGTPPNMAFQNTIDWINAMKEGWDDLYFWAKPDRFDEPFWSSYLYELGLTNPFNRRNVIDMRSFISGLDFAGSNIDRSWITDKSFAVGSHKSLDDATMQVQLVLKALGYLV